MSKLYFSGNSDSRKALLTSRGHKKITGAIYYNFDGGNEPSGTALEFSVHHFGEKVQVTVKVDGQGPKGKPALFSFSHLHKAATA